MSGVDIRLRRLEQTKEAQKSASRQQPSIGEMSDGDERVVLAGGNTLRVYRKEFGKLWYMEFTGT
tara:strand:+ start:868 stop:1062 length:195 start_codon:yes stop_codon:yes gene_type:complete